MQNIDLDATDVYLLLGSNLGDSKNILNATVALIAEQVGPIKSASAVYETAAWGKTDQPNFLNMALQVQTKLAPNTLLNVVLSIEEQLGRIRKEKWGARLIDIDVIFYGNEIVKEDHLQIPHPEMHNRRFVLAPLAEIAKTYQHPILKKSVAEILFELADPLVVVKR